MTKKAKVTVHPSYQVGEISPRLFGAFLEPIGTRVNGRMYNPNHPDADEQGFRRDYMQALRDSGLRNVRLPGGNFISCWDWKDSIGPMNQRKKHLDLAWTQYYTNEIGTDEYLQWSEKIGFEPMYTINLGTGDINDAMKIIEYTNHEGGTYWSDLRKENGHEKPYGIKIWYLGNEMDGPWQITSWEKDPRGYGILAHEVSKAMKFTDGSIETVVCISSSPFLQHYPQWDLEVLEQCYETVDYISLHHYHSAPPGDLGAFMAGSDYYEDYIRTEIALCDFVKTKLRSTKTMMISFDEWNLSMRKPAENIPFGRNGILSPDEFFRYPEGSKFTLHEPDSWDWEIDRGNALINALAQASVLMLFLRYADRIRIGCMSGGLHNLAAADRLHVWKTPSYYPVKQMIDYAKGISLLPDVECETYDVPGYAITEMNQYDTKTGVGYVEAAAAIDGDDLTVFVLNRDWKEDSDFTLDTEGFAGYELIEAIQLCGDDVYAENSYEHPDNVLPQKLDVCFANGIAKTTLHKLSFNTFRFRKK